jgi:hypothetical protein
VSVPPQHDLEIVICDVCHGRQWYLAGQPISAERAMDLAFAADALVH